MIDILVLHPSCSRFHAVLQHKQNGEWFVYDFGSTHFTKLNHKKLYAHKYYSLKSGDVLQFAKSTRMYVFKLRNENENESEMNEKQQPLSSSKSRTIIKRNGMQDMLHRLQEKITEDNSDDGHQQRSAGISWMDCNNIENESLDFNLNDAKCNPETKQLFKQLVHKQKRREKMEQQLKHL